MNVAPEIKRTFAPHFNADPSVSRTPEPDYYRSQAFFDLEKRDIFYRHWQYFCHVSQLQAPGDYVTGEIVDQAIFVMRGTDNVLRGYFNVCRHRGHQLLQGAGNVNGLIRCPYHSWSYDLKGQLRHAPHCEAVRGFDKSTVAINSVLVHVAAGFVFVNLDRDGPSFEDSLGGFVEMLAASIPDSAQLKLAQSQQFTINANWKVVVENFLENYHSFYSGPAHRQLSDIIDQSSYTVNVNGRLIEFSGRGGDAAKIPYHLRTRSISTRPDGFVIHFVWPNTAFILLPGADILLVFLIKPTGAETTSEQLLYFTRDGSVDPTSKTAVDWFNDILGPEDVELCESVQRGLHSLGYESGRLMVDPDGGHLWSEGILHHFNSLVLQSIRSA